MVLIMQCLVCGKVINQFGDTDSKPECGMWEHGSVDDFICGFGSTHDTERYMIGLCDDCLDNPVIQLRIVKTHHNFYTNERV